MNKEQYQKMRNQLMSEAENLINEGKLEESEAKMNEIKDLDNKWEETKKVQANLAALKGNEEPVNIENETVTVANAKRVDHTTTETEVVNEKDKSKAYLNVWAKEMMGMKLTEKEEVVLNDYNKNISNQLQTAATHAILIPETVRDGIWREAQELYPILNDARITFVPGDLTIIKETNGGDDAEWYDEDTEVADGEFSVGELNLTGCELSKAIPISWKLRKMSIDRFIAYIQTLLAEKMGAALAKGIVSGKGKPSTGDTFKPQPNGIITAIEAETDTPQIVGYDPANDDDLSYDKIAQAMGKIKSSYKNGAFIYAKSTMIWDKLATLKDSVGRPLFITDVSTGGVGRIFGLTVKEDDSVPEGSILIGNVARGYAINANEDITIYTEDHVKKRYTDYMGYAIVDGDVLTTKAFALIKEITQG